MPINVTKTFLPPKEELIKYIDRIYETGQLTNQGPLLQELEAKLKNYLQVPYFHFLHNGTVALQLALDALNIHEGEVITTPFSYVATTGAILWQGCKPVFVDIDPETFCIDPTKIEAALTSKTKAILAVHVFGQACPITEIEQIAKKHQLKVIYDAAHAFGAKYLGKSLVNYGDISTLSFHATKIFHSGEGGACITPYKEISDILNLNKRFGHINDNHYRLGINGKNSEFHSAIGLANFPYIDEIIEERKNIFKVYKELLPKEFLTLKEKEFFEPNYSYFPVLFQDENHLKSKFHALAEKDIFPRRYFYPSLNTLPYVEYVPMPISENISSRIACLPLYCGLQLNEIETIVKVLRD